MNLNPMTLIRRRAYRATFNTVEGRKVLADLRRFCRASVPTADVNNVQATYLLEGRREVWDGDLNLARMEVRTIKRAFRTFPKDPVKEIAKKLCISERTLNRKIKQYNLGGPRQLRYPDIK